MSTRLDFDDIIKTTFGELEAGEECVNMQGQEIVRMKDGCMGILWCPDGNTGIGGISHDAVVFVKKLEKKS